MTQSSRPVFRFAPSPNGYLHLGHAYSAILNFQMARASGGRFLLRMEDIDRTRCKPDYEAAILEDLAWLGLAWEEPVRRQSEHLDDYARALARLEARGLCFPCVCSRGDISRAIDGKTSWPGDPDGTPLYPGICKSHPPAEKEAKGLRAAIRLDIVQALGHIPSRLSWREQDRAGKIQKIAAAPERWGDTILARRDIGTSYHIAVVVDDAMAGVSTVVRGKDLFAATGLHRLLQELLGLPAPLYHHHELVLDGEGRKLSKSTRAKSLRALREEGLSRADIYAALGYRE